MSVLHQQVLGLNALVTVLAVCCSGLIIIIIIIN